MARRRLEGFFVLTLVCGIVGVAAGAVAQDTGTGSTDTPPADAGAGGGTSAGGVREGGEAGAERSTGSRVIDETQEQLQREQAQTEGERARAERERLAHERGQRDHRNQFEVRISFGVPGRFRLEYDSGRAGHAQCNDNPDDSFCMGVAEPFLDFELGFAAASTLEIIGQLRVGLAHQDFTGANTLQGALGIRAYTNPTDLAKVFVAAMALADFGSTDRGAVGDYGSFDFGVRFQEGIQFDVARYVGVFLQIGESALFLRYLDFEMDASIGVQARFP